MPLSKENVQAVLEARRRFQQADALIVAFKALGRETEAVEGLLKAEREYRKAIEDAGRELGIKD